MESVQLSIYERLCIYALGLVSFVLILYYGKTILVPLTFSVLFAILLRPPVRWLVKKKINRIVAILFTLILAGLIIVSLAILLVSQASHFGEALPLLINKLEYLINEAVLYWSGFLKIQPAKLNALLENAKDELLSHSSAFIGSTVTVTGKIIGMCVVIPVYVFLLLYYKSLLIDFVYKVSGEKNSQPIAEILSGIRSIVQKYLSGLLIESLFVAGMTIIGLLILKMEYAILLGVISSLLNIIPYLGVFIAMVICALIALVTKDSSLGALYVILLFAIVQFIDNNFLVPKIIGGIVKLNALVSITAIIAGGVLWGLAGMFLAIPLAAIIKVISDRVEALHPFGFFLGDKYSLNS